VEGERGKITPVSKAAWAGLPEPGRAAADPLHHAAHGPPPPTGEDGRLGLRFGCGPLRLL